MDRLRLRKELDQKKVLLDIAQKDYDTIRVRVEEVEKRLVELSRDNSIKISDHAIVRYLERVEGLDIESIRKKILPDEVEDKVKVLGGGKFTVGDTHKAIIRKRTVRTVHSLTWDP